MQVPTKYVIPSVYDNIATATTSVAAVSELPPHLVGMQLGLIVHNIRNKNDYADHKEELVQMGFSYEKRKKKNFAQFEAALNVFQFIHGHVQVPREYVISPTDSRYPETVRGKRLGD